MEENLNKMPEISIRTMDSDIKALEQGGGEAAAPQRFVPETKFEIPGYLGPEKPIFAPAQESLKSEMETAQESSRWLRTAGIILLIAVAIAGFGLLGYFVISRWIFPAQMPAV